MKKIITDIAKRFDQKPSVKNRPLNFSDRNVKVGEKNVNYVDRNVNVIERNVNVVARNVNTIEKNLITIERNVNNDRTRSEIGTSSRQITCQETFVCTLKPTLSKKSRSGKLGKKRVRFLDTVIASSSEKSPHWRRFVDCFHFLWQCTRRTVKSVLRKSFFVCVF